MKEAYWGYWLVVLGVFIIVVLLLVQSFTSTNSQDFYLVKSIAEASMEDAIDWGYYREYGEAKINKEKFYESFIRRFSEEASIATTYDIEFTEVYEAPPKIGIKVSSRANTFSIAGDAATFDIVNKIDAILESSAKGTVVESTLGESTAADASNLLDLINEDKNALANLENCKIKFNLGACKTKDEVDLEVLKCGKPTESGISAKDMDADTIYCVAQKTTDSTCSVTALYDTFRSNYCG